MPTLPRVLVLAEAANPEWASVPLIGWSLARALAEVAEVHLVTQIRNRPAILRAGLREGEDFTAIDSEAVARPLHRLSNVVRMGKGVGWTINTAIESLGYPYFERLVWRQFRQDLEDGRFDLVHRVTPVSLTMASPLAGRCRRVGVPFVLGPLNGGVPWPAAFDRERRREKEWLSYVRGAYRMLPGRGATLSAASAILTGSRHTQSEIPARYQSKTIYLPENAIDRQRFNKVADQTSAGPLRACFIGRLVPYKGADMAIAACAPHLKAGRMTLDILGDGPERAALEAQAREVGQGICFHGVVPHEQVQDILSSCHLLTFPSIREFGGGVVLEAMALGVVPVVVDYAGPGELVIPGTGYKVPLGTRKDIVAGLNARIDNILRNRHLLPGIAAAAKDRVDTSFTWAAKAEQIAQVYDWVLGGRSSKPAPL